VAVGSRRRPIAVARADDSGINEFVHI
jgi:hypothetical protein